MKKFLEWFIPFVITFFIVVVLVQVNRLETRIGYLEEEIDLIVEHQELQARFNDGVIESVRLRNEEN